MDTGRTIPTRLLVASLTLALLIPLAACGGGGGDVDGRVLAARTRAVGLAQAAFDGKAYEYGASGAVPAPAITGEPADTDTSRWAMLHDGDRYRLYFMRHGDDATLYQFGYDPATKSYEYGFDSIEQLGIKGTPPDADPSSIAMLHDGVDYRLYMRGRSNPGTVHQFAFNASTGSYEYGYRSIAVLSTSGVPADADFSRWAMVHDGSVYRQYIAKAGSETTLYQFGFDGRTYDYGYRSIPEMRVVGMPASSDTSSFAMQHGGNMYRLYHLTR